MFSTVFFLLREYVFVFAIEVSSVFFFFSGDIFVWFSRVGFG